MSDKKMDKKVNPNGSSPISPAILSSATRISNTIDLKNGPVEDHRRQCTDVLWLLVFLLFASGTIYIAVTSISTGNPAKLASVYDPDRNNYFTY